MSMLSFLFIIPHVFRVLSLDYYWVALFGDEARKHRSSRSDLGCDSLSAYLSVHVDLGCVANHYFLFSHNFTSITSPVTKARSTSL